MRARPASVRGPVDRPPCNRHRPLRGARAPGSHHAAMAQGCPARVCAPHLGRSRQGGRQGTPASPRPHDERARAGARWDRCSPAKIGNSAESRKGRSRPTRCSVSRRNQRRAFAFARAHASGWRRRQSRMVRAGRPTASATRGAQPSRASRSRARCTSAAGALAAPGVRPRVRRGSGLSTSPPMRRRAVRRVHVHQPGNLGAQLVLARQRGCPEPCISAT